MNYFDFVNFSNLFLKIITNTPLVLFLKKPGDFQFNAYTPH